MFETIATKAIVSKLVAKLWLAEFEWPLLKWAENGDKNVIVFWDAPLDNPQKVYFFSDLLKKKSKSKHYAVRRVNADYKPLTFNSNQVVNHEHFLVV